MFCPVHSTEMIRSRDDYACQLPSCKYGHGLRKRIWELESLDEIRSKRVRELNGLVDDLTDSANRNYAAIWIVSLAAFISGLILGLSTYRFWS